MMCSLVGRELRRQYAQIAMIAHERLGMNPFRCKSRCGQLLGQADTASAEKSSQSGVGPMRWDMSRPRGGHASGLLRVWSSHFRGFRRLLYMALEVDAGRFYQAFRKTREPPFMPLPGEVR